MDNNERAFWIAIRAALIAMVRAIEVRLNMDKKIFDGVDADVTPAPKYSE